MKYTNKEIIEAIREDEFSLDPSLEDKWAYYLHHDGEKFIPRGNEKTKDFWWPARYVDELSAKCTANHPDDSNAASDEFWDRVYTLETEDNPDFMEVVEGLRNEVNKWLEEREKEDD